MDGNISNYRVTGRIGEGAHGLVFKARNSNTGKEVALKKILIKNLEDGIPLNVMREIKALQLLRCKYVIKLHDMFPHGMSLVLVLEYMCSGLWEMLHHSPQELTMPRIKAYAEMLLKGTRYMHAHYVMHRDLKPANLLINHEGILKIADLGLARLYWPEGGRPYSHQVATRWYRAPELLYGARYYSEKVDIWAIGCIIAEMISKKPLFAGESDIEQLAIVLQHLGTPTEITWPGFTELPDYNKISFPESTPTPWNELLPGVDADAISLIKSFILYDEKKRVSAKVVVQDDCGSTSTATIDCRDASELGETYILVEDNSGTQGSTMPQPNTDIQNILLNQSTLFNITNQIMETQQKIILKLASLSVQMEESFSRMENTVPLKDASSADSNSFIVKQIKNIKELEEMESLLSDNEYKNKLKKSCSFICSGGEGNGVNCAYRFIDIFFSRDFLCECSWSGSSRDENIKISLKCYKKTLNFFFEMISHWDSSYSQEANENFFKSILKNSRKRKIVKYARVPTKRNRPKGVNSDKQQKTINDQNTIIIHPACSSKESVNNINDGEDVEEEEESLC